MIKLMKRDDIEESFDHLALFFYDPYGGSFIGVLWKPSAFVSQPFKVAGINATMFSSKSDDQDSAVIPNIEAIIEDFKLMGKGLVISVESNAYFTH